MHNPLSKAEGSFSHEPKTSKPWTKASPKILSPIFLNPFIIRIVIVSVGFAGLKLAQKHSHRPYQVVLLDKNNYHMFQPLLYQVATAALPPNAVSFPLRRIFHKTPNVIFRMAVVKEMDD
ncbi:hypothetical protein [Cecembia calidifontis]|uniref:NADH:ubiquinone reductase (non-electrogenic) n=1 Tax=Cecembia calidifontis TaxID=1187080 RepID=A0A4Q7P6C7_9BACT|nr:hypothetical protein BC751_1058 [Cecembia calidifontis]